MIHSIVIHTINRGAIRFKLGIGPCGRTVTELGIIQEVQGVLEVVQTCEDNPDEPDFFGFPLHNVLAYKIYNTDDPYPAKVRH